jgi:hypothetical protein
VLVLRLSVLVLLAPLLVLLVASALRLPPCSTLDAADVELAREYSAGRCVSRLLLALPEPALLAPRGGGGGGGMALPAMSPEEDKTRLLRLEAEAEPGAGAASLEPSSVLRLLELDAAVRTELLRWGGGGGEAADGLEEPISERRAPWRDGGGGGGDFMPLSRISLAFSAEGERGFEVGTSSDC